MRHETLIAAGVALAAVALTATMRGRSVANEAVSDAALSGDAAVTAPTNVPAVDTMAATVATPSIDLTTSADTIVRVAVPAGGTSRITVIDSSNVAVTTLTVGRETTRITDLPAGEYRVEVSNEGPAEAVGSVAISSATSVRTPAITIAPGGALTVVQDFAS